MCRGSDRGIAWCNDKTPPQLYFSRLQSVAGPFISPIMDEELRKLQELFSQAQEVKSTVRLSERNVIELVSI